MLHYGHGAFYGADLRFMTSTPPQHLIPISAHFLNQDIQRCIHCQLSLGKVQLLLSARLERARLLIYCSNAHAISMLLDC